jgi:TetR/AcrR family transcriptional repressor of nem operon
MMGALVMARVAGNSELSDEILKSGRDAVLGRASPVVKKPARRATSSV